MPFVFAGQVDRYAGELCWTAGGGNTCGHCDVYAGQTDRYAGQATWYAGGEVCGAETPPTLQMVPGGNGGNRYAPRRGALKQGQQSKLMAEKIGREDREAISIINAFLMTRH